nr:MAG TPA: hypothetical protein [Bacteriophage sp.]
MSLNNAVVNSFLKTDADLLFVLKTKSHAQTGEALDSR